MNDDSDKGVGCVMSDQFPNGWSFAELDDLCQIVRGITFPTTDKRFSPGPGLIACLRTANVQVQVEWNDLWFVPSEYVKNEGQYILENDILISTANSYELVGKVARVIAPRFPSTLGAFISLLRAESGIMPLYLYYQMSAEDTQRSIREMSSTTTNISNVSGTKLKTLKLAIAPLNEQTRIVEKLEELLSDLDAGVAELKAAQKKLVQYRQSLLKAAVEGALTAEWRTANQPKETGTQLLERILIERRARWEVKQLAKFKEQGKAPPKDWQAKYPEPVKPDTSDLPELPAGWVWASAEQICDFITKGTTPTKGIDNDGEKTIPFLRVTNLTANGTLDLFDKVFVSENTHYGFLARSKVYPGDVLMNIVGPPLGQVSVVPSLFSEWNINQAIAIFRALKGVFPEFIFLCLLSPLAQHWFKARAKTTAGQTNLTLELCRSLPIPLPPESEQLELVRLSKSGIDGIHEQVNAIHISLKQSAAQRKNILKAAFSGQLVPQDPNDEPASVLLERIRNNKIPIKRSRH